MLKSMFMKLQELSRLNWLKTAY